MRAIRGRADASAMPVAVTLSYAVEANVAVHADVKTVHVAKRLARAHLSNAQRARAVARLSLSSLMPALLAALQNSSSTRSQSSCAAPHFLPHSTQSLLVKAS